MVNTTLVEDFLFWNFYKIFCCWRKYFVKTLKYLHQILFHLLASQVIHKQTYFNPSLWRLFVSSSFPVHFAFTLGLCGFWIDIFISRMRPYTGYFTTAAFTNTWVDLFLVYLNQFSTSFKQHALALTRNRPATLNHTVYCKVINIYFKTSLSLFTITGNILRQNMMQYKRSHSSVKIDASSLWKMN